MSDRREFLLSGGVLALTLPLCVRSASTTQEPPISPSDRTIVIDALGGPGDGDTKLDVELSAKALEDIRASGLTAVNLTVSGVGSYAKDYDTTIGNIAYWNAQIAAHPDRLLLVRGSADIAAAQSSKRL